MGLTTTAPSRWYSSPTAGAWRLVVLHAPEPEQRGTAHVLAESAFRIGRAGSEQADLALEDGEVSRQHAIVEPFDGSGWRARDEGSRNGTFVDGERVEQTELADGSVIRVGSTLLLLHFVQLERLREADLDTSSALVGDSAAVWGLRHDISAIAPSALPVLVLGETGVGKELVAQEIHERSGRGGAFVPVNCAGLPDNLVESELFGHAKGAFTGATSASRGLFGEAEGGTLFLDEIGEMPLEVQPKLLRALATGEVRAVGETRGRTADVRLIAATNVDIEQAVESGAFRGDLFARLMGNTIEVPPLRARRDDVPRLLRRFLEGDGGPREISPDALEALLVHPWPFNVRELEQIARSAAARLGPEQTLELQYLPPKLRRPLETRAPADGQAASAGAAGHELPLALRIPRDREPTADELTEVVSHYEGNVSLVASFYGKERKQIYRWAERHGIDIRAYRPESAR